jgi:hypothetical protein
LKTLLLLLHEKEVGNSWRAWSSKCEEKTMKTRRKKTKTQPQLFSASSAADLLKTKGSV